MRPCAALCTAPTSVQGLHSSSPHRWLATGMQSTLTNLAAPHPTVTALQQGQRCWHSCSTSAAQASARRLQSDVEMREGTADISSRRDTLQPDSGQPGNNAKPALGCNTGVSDDCGALHVLDTSRWHIAVNKTTGAFLARVPSTCHAAVSCKWPGAPMRRRAPCTLSHTGAESMHRFASLCLSCIPVICVRLFMHKCHSWRKGAAFRYHCVLPPQVAAFQGGLCWH
jgi:hypothetical protein